MKAILQQYVDKKENGWKHCASGMWPMSTSLFLASVPDRMVHDNSTVDRFGMLEMPLTNHTHFTTPSVRNTNNA